MSTSATQLPVNLALLKTLAFVPISAFTFPYFYMDREGAASFVSYTALPKREGESN